MKLIFDKESDWKVYFPDRNIYIMKDHSWAFSAWEYERLKGKLKPDSILLHVDDHLDDVPDSLNIDGILTVSTKKELFKLTRANKEYFSDLPLQLKIQIDNFIWPSFARGTVGTMYIISPQADNDFASEVVDEFDQKHGRFDIRDTLSLIPIEKFRNVKRHYNYQEFKERSIEDFLRDAADKSKILNLDLDYFVPANRGNNIMEDTEIRNILEDLLTLCKWDAITVAISPDYCGNEQNALHLLEIFCEIAILDINKAEEF